MIIKKAEINRRDFLRLSGGGLLLVVTGGALAGCGGGGGSSGSPSGPGSPGGGGGTANSFTRTATPISFPIDWSGGNAKSVVVTLMGAQPVTAIPHSITKAHTAALGAASDFIWTINRGTDTSSTYKSPQPALNGTSILSLDFYDAPDGGGNKAYHVAFVVDIDTAGAGVPQIKPGASPDGYSAPRGMTVGTKTDVPPLVTGHSGTAVVALAPGAVTYKLLDGADAVQLNADGSLRGIKDGSATVSATAGGSEVARTKVTASFAFDSLNLIIDGDPGGYAPGPLTYYDIGQQKAVSATYSFSGSNAPTSWAFVWEGLDSTQVPNSTPVYAPLDNRTNFKFTTDSTSTALHPKATLTALRPGPKLEATYWIRLSDSTLYGQDSIYIRVPSLGKYGKEGLIVSKDVSGTGLNYVDITQRDTSVSPDTGLNGAGIAYYTENGTARKADVTWVTGWRTDGGLGVIGGLNLGWGDVFFSGTDVAGGSGLTFQGKYVNPDTTDFTHAVGTVTIGKYVAAVTLVKDGGDLSGPGGGVPTGAGGTSIVDMGQGPINGSATWLKFAEGKYVLGFVFGDGEQILMQLLSITPGSNSLSYNEDGYAGQYIAADFTTYNTTSGDITITSANVVDGNPLLIGTLSANFKSDTGSTRHATVSFQAEFRTYTPSLRKAK